MEKLNRCLNPEGYLFVGHAESLFGLTDKFRMIHENNGTAYQRMELPLPPTNEGLEARSREVKT